MGQGAYLTIANATGSTITTSVTAITCFFNNGQDGSDFTPFQNRHIPPHTTLPAQYIEARASGDCAGKLSYFYFNFAPGRYMSVQQVNNAYQRGPGTAGIAHEFKRQGQQYHIHLKLLDLASAEAAQFPAVGLEDEKPADGDDGAS
jgi:hypothetical protein